MSWIIKGFEKATGLAPLLLICTSTTFSFYKQDEYVRILPKLLGHNSLGILHGPPGFSPLRNVPRHGTRHRIGVCFIAYSHLLHLSPAPPSRHQAASSSPAAPMRWTSAARSRPTSTKSLQATSSPATTRKRSSCPGSGSHDAARQRRLEGIVGCYTSFVRRPAFFAAEICLLSAEANNSVPHSRAHAICKASAARTGLASKIFVHVYTTCGTRLIITASRMS